MPYLYIRSTISADQMIGKPREQALEVLTRLFDACVACPNHDIVFHLSPDGWAIEMLDKTAVEERKRLGLPE